MSATIRTFMLWSVFLAACFGAGLLARRTRFGASATVRHTASASQEPPAHNREPAPAGAQLSRRAAKERSPELTGTSNLSEKGEPDVKTESSNGSQFRHGLMAKAMEERAPDLSQGEKVQLLDAEDEYQANLRYLQAQLLADQLTDSEYRLRVSQLDDAATSAHNAILTPEHYSALFGARQRVPLASSKNNEPASATQ